MRALLDVNVLLALLDAGHVQHGVAMAWLAAHHHLGWASCPLTQNGCLRILSLPSYPNTQPVGLVAQRLQAAASDAAHEFWPDDISLLQAGVLDWQRVLSSRQVTDLYLLALAVRHRARLVTFDRAIPLAAAPGAKKEHLLILD